MSQTAPQRKRLGTTVLAGIGLVIAGLLTGVLLMLTYVNDRINEVTAQNDVVEPVQLEPAPAVLRPTLPADTMLQTGFADAATLSRTFQSVASRVTPAVVYIRVRIAGGEDERRWFPSFRQQRESVGSGVIISQDGYVVTNHHVIEGAQQIWVTLDDKREYRARVVGADPSTDLAVIQMRDADNLPVVPLGNSEILSVGEWVIAIGNPFRLTSTVTAGIISALGRQVNIIEDRFSIEDFIQTDAAINPGNSGGALVNMAGELIGINTAIATESGSYEGYGFAVPVNLVDRVATDLIAYGEVRRGFLGVNIGPVNADLAESLGLDRIGGVMLERVSPGGSADRAGLERGDVILSINGYAVDAPNELQRTIASFRPGDFLVMKVWRDARIRMFEVELLGSDDPFYRSWMAEMDQPPPPIEDPATEPEAEAEAAFEIQAWGIGIKDLNTRIQERFNATSGVYIAFVRHGSHAYVAGLPRHAVITHINGTPIASVQEALGLLGQAELAGGAVLFRVLREEGRVAFYEAPSLSAANESSE